MGKESSFSISSRVAECGDDVRERIALAVDLIALQEKVDSILDNDVASLFYKMS
jgi:hypothetical protein